MPAVRIGHADGQITVAAVPEGDDWSRDEQFRAITHDDGVNTGVWSEHRKFSQTDTPSWIASNDPELEARLANHYGCAQGEPHTGHESGQPCE